jgi:hypothetical protein
MSNRADAAYVVERMQVRDLPRAYVLGCRAPRVTVLSQQFRAFNLIWALFEEGRLRSGDRVGVVGGGIGGLTAAAAAMIKGCSVVLAEERQQLMHLQRRNTTRLLHPNIYEWPSPGSEENSTRFPCMNWTADLAGVVVARLDDEWEALAKEHRPEVHTGMRITTVRPDGAGQLVIRKEDEWMSDPCDVVVLAVGFGVEPPAPGLALDSYWENDKLEQPTRGGQIVRTVLVSGLGDGGCIDVLRLKYANFQHTKFAAAVTRHPELERYKSRLREIDENMPAADCEKYLRDEYAKLDLPSKLAESLGTIRTDTRVVLNGPDPVSPLSPNACVLHRVAVWALVVCGEVRYQPGRINRESITSEPVPNGIKYFVPFEGSGRPGFDAIVIRHGPAPCLTTFPEIARGYAGIPETAAADRTRHKIYPDGFYPARQAPQPVVRHADAVFPDSRPDTPPPGVDLVVPPPAEFPAEPIGSAQRHALERAASAAHLADIESLTRRLVADTRAENYMPAVEASNALDAILNGPGPDVPPALWRRGHQALFDFELFARRRTQAGGGRYDLARLHDLLRRMRREPG